MNQYSVREATNSDQLFILNLLKDKLSNYNLHQKRLPSSKANPKFRPFKIHEIEIENVYIVLHGQEKVGAYKLQYDGYGKFYRIFWLASTGVLKGVGTFIIQESITHSTYNQCQLIKLSVNKSNQDAFKCYSSNGFKIVNDGEEENEMELKITI